MPALFQERVETQLVERNELMQMTINPFWFHSQHVEGLVAHVWMWSFDVFYFGTFSTNGKCGQSKGLVMVTVHVNDWYWAPNMIGDSCPDSLEWKNRNKQANSFYQSHWVFATHNLQFHFLLTTLLFLWVVSFGDWQLKQCFPNKNPDQLWAIDSLWQT